MPETNQWENTPTCVPCSPEAECQENAEAATQASFNNQLSSYLEEFVADTEAEEMAFAENVNDNPPHGERASAAMTPLGVLKVINAHVGSDAGGTINLGQIEPFCEGVRKMPMYTVFEAAVVLPGATEPVVLYGYINRYGSTSYWGSRFIPNGKKCRVVWEEDKLVPLPGKAESVMLSVTSFACRNASDDGKAVA